MSCAMLAGCCLASCTAHDEPVFLDIGARFELAESSASEDQALQRIWVELTAPASEEVEVYYRIASENGELALAAGEDEPVLGCRGADALLQDVIRTPGEVEARVMNPRPRPAFEGSLHFDPGQTRAAIEMWVLDDDKAELDEALTVSLFASSVGELLAPSEHRQLILDNDRSELLNVVEFGADPTGVTDTTQEIQAAIDTAAGTQRAIVHFPPGQYLVSALRLSPGIALVGYEATLVRPAAAGQQTRTITMAYSGPVDSLASRISGLTIDGQRTSQGEFMNQEFSDANLIEVSADPILPGRALITIEDVGLRNGPGNGIAINTGVHAKLCDIDAVDVYTDAVHMIGGGSKVDVVGLTARGMVGTTGIAIFGSEPFLGSRRIELTMRDSILGTGDIELGASERSEIELTNVVMEDSHFRLRAEESNVRVSDSVIRFGIVDALHNHFLSPSNVRFSNSDLYLSESYGGKETEEATRDLAMIEVDFNPLRKDELREARQELSFVNCRFHVEDDIEDDDTLYVARVHPNGGLLPVGPERTLLPPPDPADVSLGGTLTIIGGSFDRRFDDVFAPDCTNCTFRP